MGENPDKYTINNESDASGQPDEIAVIKDGVTTWNVHRYCHHCSALNEFTFKFPEGLNKRESGWQPKPPASAINALIGYLSVLKPGEVVTHEYITRLNEHYIPALEKGSNPPSA